MVVDVGYQKRSHNYYYSPGCCLWTEVQQSPQSPNVVRREIGCPAATQHHTMEYRRRKNWFDLFRGSTPQYELYTQIGDLGLPSQRRRLLVAEVCASSCCCSLYAAAISISVIITIPQTRHILCLSSIIFILSVCIVLAAGQASVHPSSIQPGTRMHQYGYNCWARHLASRGETKSTEQRTHTDDICGIIFGFHWILGEVCSYYTYSHLNPHRETDGRR